jgi:hypothetical protein
MVRLFRFVVAFALAVGALLVAGEPIPVDHREPIMVRVLNGEESSRPTQPARLVCPKDL